MDYSAHYLFLTIVLVMVYAGKIVAPAVVLGGIGMILCTSLVDWLDLKD